MTGLGRNAESTSESNPKSGAKPVSKSQMRRLLVIASAGGHWVQLSRLSPAFEGHDALYVTTRNGAAAPTGHRAVAVVQDASRTRPMALILLVIQLLWLMIRFRPHVAITTGAAPGLIALRIGKSFGCRTVWIDSIANSEELSLSGKLAENCADLWLTQWPHLTEYNPRLKSIGAVL